MWGMPQSSRMIVTFLASLSQRATSPATGCWVAPIDVTDADNRLKQKLSLFMFDWIYRPLIRGFEHYRGASAMQNPGFRSAFWIGCQLGQRMMCYGAYCQNW